MLTASVAVMMHTTSGIFSRPLQDVEGVQTARVNGLTLRRYWMMSDTL